MQVFVINLKAALFRRERMSNLLRQRAINFTLIDAIDGFSLTNQNIQAMGLFSQLGLSRPEYGAMLSHIKVWRKMLTEDIKQCVILEDDVHLSPSFKKVIENIHFPFDLTALFRLETDFNPVKHASLAVQSISNIDIHQLHSPHRGCAGYIINKTTAQYLLNNINLFQKPIDVELFDASMRSFRGFNVYQCMPAVIVQDFKKPFTEQDPLLFSQIQHQQHSIKQSQSIFSRIFNHKQIFIPFENTSGNGTDV